MAGRKSIEHRACPICRRKTIHVIERSKNGVGRTLAEVAKCREHREWADGRIEVRDPVTGEWVEVRPPDEKTA